jgi:mannosyltransferase
LTAAGLGVVALGALVLRGINLAGPSLWADEANTVQRALLPIAQLLPTLAAFDTHPPLYYLTLKPWLGLFGTSEMALRGFSVLWGLVAVALVVLAAREIGGWLAGVVGGLLAATMPTLVIFAQEGRGYTLLAALGLGSFLLLRRATDTGRWADWAAYAVVTSLSLYTHNLAAPWVVWQVAVLLVRSPRAWPRFAVAQLAAYALFAPWAWVLLAQTQALAGGGWLGAPDGAALAFSLVSFVGGASSYREGDLRPAFALTHPYLVAAPVLLAYAGARRLPRKESLSLLVFAVVPIGALFLVAQVVHAYVDRALLPSALGVVLLSAGAFRTPLARTDGLALGGALAVTLGLYAGSLVAYHASPRDDYRGLAADLAARSRADETILFVPGFGRVAFEYYWRQVSGAARVDDLDEPGGAERLEELLRAKLGAVYVVRVAAPPPPAAENLDERLQAIGLRRRSVRDHPDVLLRAEEFR